MRLHTRSQAAAHTVAGCRSHTVAGCLSFGCRLGDAGALAIADALRVNGSLTSLDLGGNMIRKEGGVAIAETFKVNGSLMTLSLASNQLEDAGAVAVALNLMSGSIGNTVVLALGAALTVSGSLGKLEYV